MILEEVRQEIANMRDEGKSYQFIGDKYGVNKGIIYRIYKYEYEPGDTEIRRRLGLEDETVDFIKQVRSSTGRFIKKE